MTLGKSVEIPKQGKLKKRPSKNTLPKSCLAEVLEPLAHIFVCQDSQTDQDHGNNHDPDQEAERTFNNRNQEKYAEDRGDD